MPRSAQARGQFRCGCYSACFVVPLACSLQKRFTGEAQTHCMPRLCTMMRRCRSTNNRVSPTNLDFVTSRLLLSTTFFHPSKYSTRLRDLRRIERVIKIVSFKVRSLCMNCTGRVCCANEWCVVLTTVFPRYLKCRTISRNNVGSSFKN